MGSEEVEQECLALLGKAQELLSQALTTHDKREQRRLRKEARNLERLAEHTMKEFENAKANTTTTTDKE